MNNNNAKQKPPLAHIGDIVSVALKTCRREPENAMTRIKGAWENVVGERIFAHCRPMSLKNGTLIVHVSSSTWLHHLGYLKKEILPKVNQAAGNRIVRDLRFRIGTLGNE